MGHLSKGTLASLPPRSILGHFRWPCPAREASKLASKAMASLSRVLMARADCNERPRAPATRDSEET
eukprot:5836983-Pyramimonas_sp.AAC.1